MNSNRKFIFTTFCITFILLLILSLPIVIIDPFFHYHKPLKSFFYPIFNQRSQNDGITKHFDYNAIITGTSMTENFKTSEANKIFNSNFIKVPYSGGSFYEINRNLITAFKYNKELKIIIRGLDKTHFAANKDAMRNDLGKYPNYLYDNNCLNDVYYIFNKEILSLICESLRKPKGITDFDHYSYWMPYYTFGNREV